MEDGKIIWKGVAKAEELKKKQSKKSNILHSAYEAAVNKLGYSDEELMNRNKSIKVVKLMYSEFLNNAEFNPLRPEGFDEMSDDDQQRSYEHNLGMNIDTFTSDGGMIDRLGGLRRQSFTNMISNHADNEIDKRLKAYFVSATYNEDEDMLTNRDRYLNEISQDPALAGNDVTKGIHMSLDDIASDGVSAMRGNTNRNHYEHVRGIQFE